ncbi:MAG TPA: MbnP family protein [Candidatus Latescibacteria bacterium]|jgi:hypothetical protein|nr:hypothetical protein [Gemmatimonadaceae bacterium]MDP6016512.1 hypothetical protein [Candidatus Latescibacterota bacterium]HJP30424.1 MbnP family protein [Candidatus Latescibacterota bacterium]
MRHPFRLAALSLVTSLYLLACGDDEDDAGTLTVHFDHQIADETLDIDAMAIYTNAAGNTYTVSRLEYIVTDIDLIRDDGATYHLRDEHYRNAASAATTSFTAIGVPAAQYSACRFVFGIDPARNVTGALPNTSDFNNMEWPAPMGGGYHYMRLEGLFDDGGESQAFLSHLGPSGGSDFSFVVELPLSLHVDGEDSEIHIVMDVNEWFEDPVVYDLAGQGMIMGNADAQLTHQANGATVFTVSGSGRHDHDHDEDDHDE